MSPENIPNCGSGGVRVGRALEVRRIVCDVGHMQSYTWGGIRTYDLSVPRSAVVCLDDPYELSL